MKNLKIHVMKMIEYNDLIEKYENNIEHTCNMHLGDVYYLEGLKKPDGFCESAWTSIYPFAMTLAYGGENFFDGWMKNSKSCMVSCNDGFRPVSFLIEVI